MDKLIIAGEAYSSRLLVGTGKYKDFEETRVAVDASGAEIITVAIRRTNLGQNPEEPNLLDVLALYVVLLASAPVLAHSAASASALAASASRAVATVRPSRRTTTRSLPSVSSSISDEIISTPRPASASAADGAPPGQPLA